MNRPRIRHKIDENLMYPQDTTPHKTCTKCGESKPATAEYFSRAKRGWFFMCKVCVHQEYQVRIDDPDATIHTKLYLRYLKTGDPDAFQELAAYYGAQMPNDTDAYERREAHKRNNGGSHTAKDIQRQYQAQKGKCYYCRKKVGDSFHADHAIPLSRGGSDGPENIVITCPKCNLAKHNKLPSEWVEGGRLL